MISEVCFVLKVCFMLCATDQTLHVDLLVKAALQKLACHCTFLAFLAVLICVLLHADACCTLLICSCAMHVQLVELFKEYFGGDLNERSIRNNFVLM